VISWRVEEKLGLNNKGYNIWKIVGQKVAHRHTKS